jgi:hypothetical protein
MRAQNDHKAVETADHSYDWFSTNKLGKRIEG